MPEGRMKGKRVLVTGAGTGIGKGIAIEFAREGAVVALHYAHSEKGALAAVEEITAFGGKARMFKADFSDWEEAKALPGRAADFLDGLDVLVNNAGITMNQPFLETTIEQFDTLYNVNIKAMFFATQGAVPLMLAEGAGSVINISSVHAYGAMIEHPVYASTKAAIIAFTRTLSIELIQKNIRVNCICPGAADTPMLPEFLVQFYRPGKDLDMKQTRENALRTIPLRRFAQPDDIAQVALFLASDEASYLTGVVIPVDGGMTAG